MLTVFRLCCCGGCSGCDECSGDPPLKPEEFEEPRFDRGTVDCCGFGGKCADGGTGGGSPGEAKVGGVDGAVG